MSIARRRGNSGGPGAWSGRTVTRARDFMAARLPAPCALCSTIVETRENMRVGHIKARVTHPHLTLDPSNWQIECVDCSNSGGQRAVIENATKRALAEHGLDPVLPDDGASGQTPPLPGHTHKPENDRSVLDPPVQDRDDLFSPVWLESFREIPGDAAFPLFMTPAHPRAVGSYGAQAVEWAEKELGIILRWWQRLAITRQLEHDADGSLVWTRVLESCPRRAGKSVRLRVLALWRIAHADLFGEPQEVLHCGRDLSIAREIHRAAWRWADERAGWTVRRGVGQEEIETDTGSRWLVRSTDGVYGWSPGLAMVDESWDVEPRVVDDGLEPALLDRESPQLHLTSTSHRLATSLMPKALASAVRGDEPNTLVLLWGARAGADPADPATWRAASPHWTAQREQMIREKYGKALAGEEDPEADDLDPVRGWESQYLNVWRTRPARRVPGSPVVDVDTWSALAVAAPLGVPGAVAVEAAFDGAGLSVARAWQGRVKQRGAQPAPGACMHSMVYVVQCGPEQLLFFLDHVRKHAQAAL